MKYCTKCVYPISAVNLMIEEDVCSSCQSFEAFEKVTEEDLIKKKNKLTDILQSHQKKNKSNYDCLIPVSGGKDSYYQIHCIVKDLGLKPLLVTYDGNNFLPEGAYNRDMMKVNFDADHITWSPSVDTLKKLNRIGFKKMGDMNWHNHCGIFSSPIQIAEKFSIPFIIWGEINWDVSGMFDPNDFVEFSARVRQEHNLRGFEWNDFINDPVNKLNEKDLLWAKYPSDEEIINKNIRGLYIGNFYKWDPNQHTQLMKDLYGWRESEKPFERTYRKFSNLDDRYENGVHDLMKFIKFGYGRCSDHASKDIRLGYMNRQKAIDLVKKYDHVISSDLQHWLNYVSMSEDEFWNIADGFRDHRVWGIENNQWVKNDIDGVVRPYGNVNLNESQKNNFLKKK